MLGGGAQCLDCGRQFNTYANGNTHHVRMHQKKVEKKCHVPACGKSFTIVIDWANHLRVVHRIKQKTLQQSRAST